MLSYPSAITLSTRTLNWLAELIRAHRAVARSRWRRLDAAGQALLVLAHLRNGDTYARLAAGFGIGTTTAWRYVREAVNLLASAAEDVTAAAARAARLAYAILDGTPRLGPFSACRGWRRVRCGGRRGWGRRR
jgi:hypothetical protein